MSAIRKFQISIEDIVSVGATCRPENIKVSFEKPFCADIACEYDENTRTIDIEVGPECDNTCLYVVIECTEQCIDCYERIKVCACSGEADCDGCSDCIDGVCVSRCTHDEFCDGNECVECNSDIPCPDGKICQNGKCVCPDGQFKDEAGRCVPCLPGECPPCHVCTPEGCKPIDCGDKVCDPTLNDCVECVGSGDCRPNEKCVNNDCVCKDGYVRNANGDCVKDRECNSDTDCPDCFECDEFGNCNPKVCPAGEICIGDDCVTPCETGADCPPGFGCDGEKCVECNTLDCATSECADVLGCGCNRDNKCVDTTKCDGDCVSFADCGEGCTCYKGKCISCEDLPCDMCDVPGCACIGNKCTSVDVGCTDDVIVSEDTLNCDLIGTATIRDNCNCTPLTVTIEPTVARATGEFDFRAILRKGSATSYTDATLKNSLDNVSAINIAENELPESGVIGLEVELVVFRVDDNERRIANNITVSYFTSSFSFIGEAQSIINNVKLERVGDIGKYHPNDNLDYKIYSQRIKIKHIADIEIPGSNCTYVENNDVIKNELIDAATYNELIASRNVNDPVFDVLKDYHNFTSDGVRNPFFTWYRIPATGTNFDLNDPNQAFRKMYISGSLGSYVDTLKDKDDGLYNGYKYALYVDCPCDNNLDIQGQVKICNPNQFTGTFQNCGTEFTANTFSVCDINGFLGTDFQPSDAVVKYELLFDGSNPSSLPETKNVFKWNNTSLVNEDGDTLFQAISNGNDTIGSVTLRIFTDSTEICEYTIPGVEVDERIVDYELNCEGPAPQVRVYKEGASGGTITDLQVLNATANDDNGSLDYWILTKNGSPSNSFDIIATFANGCVKEETITVDICDCLDVTVTTESNIVFEEETTVTVNVSGFIGEYNVDIRKGVNDQVTQKIGLTSSSVDLSFLAEEVDYRIIVTSLNAQGSEPRQCTKELTFSLNGINTNIGFEGSTVCEGENKFFTINNIPPSLEGYVLNYSSSASSSTSNVTLTGNTSQDVILDDDPSYNITVGDFKLKTSSGGTIIYEYNDSVTSEVVDKPIVTSLTLVDENDNPLDGNLCTNTSAFIKVVGTPGATVTFNQNVSPIVLNNSGEGSIGLDTNSAEFYNLTISSITLNNCESSSDKSLDINITDSSNLEIRSEIIPCYDNSINTLIGFYVNESPVNSDQLEVVDDSGNSQNFSFFEEVNDPNSQYQGWYLSKKEFDQDEQDSINTVTATYTSNSNCVKVKTANVPVCSEESNTSLSVVKRYSCSNQDVEIDINDLQVETSSGIVDVLGGQYNVTVLENGSSVGSSGEGGTISFIPSGSGMAVPIEYEIDITGGSLSGLTLNQSDTINVYTDIAFEVTSTPLISNWGEDITVFVSRDIFNSYELVVNGTPTGITNTNGVFTWTAPNSNTFTTFEIIGTGYTQGGSNNLCVNTSSSYVHETSLGCNESGFISRNVNTCTFEAKQSVPVSTPVILKDNDNNIYANVNINVTDLCNSSSTYRTDTEEVLIANPENGGDGLTDFRITLTKDLTNSDTITALKFKKDDGTGTLSDFDIVFSSPVNINSGTAAADILSEITDAISADSSTGDFIVSVDTITTNPAVDYRLFIACEILNSPTNPRIGIDNLGVRQGDSRITLDGIGEIEFDEKSIFLETNAGQQSISNLWNIPCDSSTSYKVDVRAKFDQLENQFDKATSNFNEIVIGSLPASVWIPSVNDSTNCDDVTLELTTDPCSSSSQTTTYQWQKLISGTWTDQVGQTDPTLNIGYDDGDYRINVDCGSCSYTIND